MDLFYLGDCLRGLNLNPTLKMIENLGGTKKKGEKFLKLEEVNHALKNIFLFNSIFLVLSNLQRGQELKRYRIIWGLYWMFEAVWQNGKWHNDVGRIGAYSVISWWASIIISTAEPLYYKYPLLFMWNCQKKLQSSSNIFIHEKKTSAFK